MTRQPLSFDAFDEKVSPRPEETDFDRVVGNALSRRGFLGVMSFGLGAFVAGTTGLTRAALAATDRFGFEGIAASTADTITLPEGFDWKPVVLWGDPLFPDAPAFDPETRGTADTQARAFGDNNDGMSIFLRDGRHVMAVNNEYTNLETLWTAPETPSEDDIRKGMMAHGVSIFEVRQGAEGWEVVTDSPLNRRITPETEMDITGPAAGHALLRTEADPEGRTTRGTWNNCGNGETPWGTYLTCEENFNGYFSSSDPAQEIAPDLARYGISAEDWGYGWAQIDPRFDIARHPNEPNRAGYVVEIDPFDPAARPKKRTALGRFKHENAACTIAPDGHAVVYLGDDERGEFLYRFVSDGVHSATGDNADLLETGRLFVARFAEDMTGEWVELTPEATGMEAAEILIHTRQAGSAVGATTMDRPEWVAVNPARPEAFVALTNNRNRGLKPNAGGDETPVNGPNPRTGNEYGQILRIRPDDEDHAATGFTWSLFALAGNPEVHDDAFAGSGNITAGNMFNSPDGMAFDTTGLLWIQTDGNYSNAGDFAGQGNNQMLAGDTVTGEIRRFLVGPRECEVTGLCISPDRRTMFVGIQHPGEEGGSTFPGGGLPRSGVFAVTRRDGGPIG
ncbi:transcriptional initiation protein Tat [Pseudooceanicola nanhaiensis]|jgi:secreted PhoX family phosphatase|uniref:Transcriptional initiation protein Tat n=1 Tax=Pseudooceanicola nanhaiensis TaxID=375761 RepID=A0A917WEL9_9RHOB|nr:PhoX family phosphatase [Pseudooceanicola nanhaiensis]GGL96076.1 transcriptional initiation protein Tat [Pseudooceanicola nanhaiensis]